MTRQRDTYFDWLKCVAIALVVFSHVYGGQAHIHTPWLQALYNFIISCNMPLFFAISGYFAYRVIEEVDTKRLLGSLRSYLQPWLVFVGLLLVGDVILYKYDGGGGVSYLLRLCLREYWFLKTLSICLVLAFVTAMLIRAKGFRALALVASAVILMMLPNARVFLYQISAPQSMYPWFLFGLMALHRWRVWEDKRITIPATIFTIGLSLFTGNIYTNGLSFYTEGSYLIQILGSLKASALFVIRTFWGFCGIVSTMWLVSLCKRRIGTCRAVENVGENTLGIYLLHVLILRYCKLGEISFFSALLYTAVLLIVCTLLSYWIRRLRPLSLVIFGK